MINISDDTSRAAVQAPPRSGPTATGRPGAQGRCLRRSRVLAGIATGALTFSGLVSLVGASGANADTAPPTGTPATVSADALPTVQINGVVWAQATVGNTVYVTGQFTRARPAGAAAGTSEVVRSNLLAYNITTGVLITTFAHSLNAQGRSITASPDGKRVYVGGDFTTVDGVAHNHLAAFDVATGTLVAAFKPTVNATVRALSATNTVVYAGGDFTSAGGVARSYAAEFLASTGAVQAWHPVLDNGITAMTLTADGTRVFLGGRFVTVNGVAAPGLYAVNASTGANGAWPANFPIVLGGASSAVTSLVADKTQVYGTSYYFTRGGNYEGRFALDPVTGAVNWLNSCHGDSYGTFPIGQVLYTAGHAHDCSDLGDYNQDNLSPLTATHHPVMAETTFPTGVLRTPVFAGGNGVPGPRYSSFAGFQHTSELDWYPTMSLGTYTGQSQAAWSVTGNANYVSFGGEFPRVNGTAQQGLVRFAIRSLAPNAVAPVASTTLTPVVTSPAAGTLRVAWQSTWDQDNESLTYRLFRDSGTTAIFTTTVPSRFWWRPMLGFRDTGLVAGSSHTYRVTVTDPTGRVRTGTASTAATVAGTTPAVGTYAAMVRADGATHLWPLDQTGGTRSLDAVGYDDLVLGAGVTSGTDGPAGAGSGSASTFDGGDGGTAGTVGNSARYATFSVESWVRTTSDTGGLVLGYGLYQNADSVNEDRFLCLDSTGRARFGVFGGTNTTLPRQDALADDPRINDGQWHHLVGTLSDTDGARLYVDGHQVAADPTMRSTSVISGYWRVGGDQLFGWPDLPINRFTGSIADAAVYPVALSPVQVLAHASSPAPAPAAP